MPSPTSEAYKAALPKPNRLRVGEIVGVIAGLLAIGTPALAWFYGQNSFHEKIFSFYLVALVTIVLTHSIIRERQKRHRYAEAILYLHYVNHRIRDCLEHVRIETTVSQLDINRLSSEILDAIKACFQLVTGKNCRTCLKSLDNNQIIETECRDSVSNNIRDNRAEGEQTPNHLEKNTAFKDLWYGVKGASRYFLCNNLTALYRKGNYKNSSFDEVGYPEMLPLPLGAKVVTNWSLSYKSTLVVPIRYIAKFDYLEGGEASQQLWGFLCIDSKSRWVFDKTYCPELAGAFADALFILYSQLGEMSEIYQELDKQTRPDP